MCTLESGKDAAIKSSQLLPGYGLAYSGKDEAFVRFCHVIYLCTQMLPWEAFTMGYTGLKMNYRGNNLIITRQLIFDKWKMPSKVRVMLAVLGDLQMSLFLYRGFSVGNLFMSYCGSISHRKVPSCLAASY